MNKVNENEVRLANLQAAAEKRRAELTCIRAGATRQMAKVIEDAVAASGVGGYALRKGRDGELRDVEYMTLEGKIDGKPLHDIDIHFGKDSWRDEEEGMNRVLSVETCCSGSVKAGDKSGVAYCVLMGYLVTHLQEIQDALNAIPEWKDYDRAVRVYRFSDGEARAFARQMMVDAKNAARAKAEARLVVGAGIAVAYEKEWDCEKCESVITGVSTMEVERVTAKLVFFREDYRQYKKADVLNFLATGLEKGGWSFVADVDLSNAGVSRPVRL